MARELGWESELMGTASGLTLVVIQCCSHPQNSLGHSFSDPPPKKTDFNLRNEEDFFFFYFLFFFFYNLPDIFILQGGHLSQHRKITILTNLFLSFPSVVDK